MKTEDKKRIERGDLLTDKDELIVLAPAKEGFLLEFEAKMRVGGQVPNPWQGEEVPAVQLLDTPHHAHTYLSFLGYAVS